MDPIPSTSDQPSSDYSKMSLEELLTNEIDVSPLQALNKENVMRSPCLSEDEMESWTSFYVQLAGKVLRFQEIISEELNKDKVLTMVMRKLREFEKIFDPRIWWKLGLPEPTMMIEEYIKQVLNSKNVESKPLIEVETEQVEKSREKCKWYKFKTECGELKVKCHNVWVKLERMKLVCKRLMVARDWIKREMWEKIVSIAAIYAKSSEEISNCTEKRMVFLETEKFFKPVERPGQLEKPAVSSTYSNLPPRLPLALSNVMEHKKHFESVVAPAPTTHRPVPMADVFKDCFTFMDALKYGVVAPGPWERAPKMSGVSTSESINRPYAPTITEQQPITTYTQMCLNDLINAPLNTYVLGTCRTFRQNECQKEFDDLRNLRQELLARTARYKELIDEELNDAFVIEVVHSKIKEIEELFEPSLRGNLDKILNIPDPTKIFEKYRKKTVRANNVKFKTRIEPAEERVQWSQRNLERLDLEDFDSLESFEDEKLRLTNALNWAVERAEVFQIWMETMRLRLKSIFLKDVGEWLRKEIWENIISRTISFVKNFPKTLDCPETVRKIEEITRFFEPFSIVKEKAPPLSSTSSEVGTNSEPAPVESGRKDSNQTSPKFAVPALPVKKTKEKQRKVLQEPEVSSSESLSSEDRRAVPAPRLTETATQISHVSSTSSKVPVTARASQQPTKVCALSSHKHCRMNLETLLTSELKLGVLENPKPSDANEWKLEMKALGEVRHDLLASMNRFKRLFDSDLDEKVVARAVKTNVMEVEQLFDRPWREKLQLILRIPETDDIIEEYRKKVATAMSIPFEGNFNSEKKDVDEARKALEQLKGSGENEKMEKSRLKCLVEWTVLRFEVKKLAFNFEWRKASSKELVKAREWVMEQMWDEVVSHMIEFLNTFKATDNCPGTLQKIAEVTSFFMPFSKPKEPQPKKLIQVAQSSQATSTTVNVKEQEPVRAPPVLFNAPKVVRNARIADRLGLEEHVDNVRAVAPIVKEVPSGLEQNGGALEVTSSESSSQIAAPLIRAPIMAGNIPMTFPYYPMNQFPFQHFPSFPGLQPEQTLPPNYSALSYGTPEQRKRLMAPPYPVQDYKRAPMHPPYQFAHYAPPPNYHPYPLYQPQMMAPPENNQWTEWIKFQEQQSFR